ncbi:hypothetical protein MKW98_003432 [Papaver atlanticum]|uniref:Uncharacterized protein n=1 Tax=Papaver atlanticum TaxID=357466 RepID=A0AAD4T8P5_9MAGN|nr:hypothetical protein MKW98_003432 [Papaver atlanticum]
MLNFQYTVRKLNMGRHYPVGSRWIYMQYALPGLISNRTTLLQCWVFQSPLDNRIRRIVVLRVSVVLKGPPESLYRVM